jgi:hypothetical protein
MAYTHDSDVTISGDVGIGSETIDQLGWGTSDGKQLTVYSGTTDKPAVLNLVSENRDTDGSIGALLFGQKTGGSYYSKVSGERDGSDTSFGLSFVTAYDSGIHERMRIKADGNVGIGETNPTSKLAIVGSHASQNSLHSQSAGSGRSGYFIGGPNTGASNGVYIQSGSNSSDWGLNIYNRANTAAQFIVRGDGNVGIGTSSPNALLHINKAASGVMPAMHLERTGAMNHYIGYDTDNKLVIGENVDMVSTVRMAIDTNGRVGIGTSSPLNKLTLKQSTPSLRFQSANGDAGICGMEFTHDPAESSGESYAVKNAIVSSADSAGNVGWARADMHFVLDDVHDQGSYVVGDRDAGTLGDTKMIITHAGKVGINYITPYGTLDVHASSDGNARGVVIKSAYNATSNYFHATYAALSTTANLMYTAKAGNSDFKFLSMGSAGAGDPEFNFYGDGDGTCDGSWTGGGADYAEYFEWSDGNTSNEDRRGFSVVLEGDKIKPAIDGDSPIGVISATPAVVGDGDIEKWKQKHLRSDFGDYLWETYTVTEWINEDGAPESYATDKIPSDVNVPSDATVTTHTDKGNLHSRRVLNPDWVEGQEYISREDRPEWDTVGLMGKVRILKGQPTASNWIKMKDVSDTVEMWFVK